MRSLRLLSLVLLAALTAGACDSGPGGSLYDPDDRGNEAPVIDAVSPSGVVLAGIDEVTITGRNFSADASQNLVFFDDGAGTVARATVLSASTTELRVKAPNLPNPDLRVRVSVIGAQDFSNAVAVPLTPAVVSFGDLDAGILEDPKSITSGPDGALYVTLYVNGVAVGIRQFSADGTRSDFSTQDALWSSLALADDGALIALRQDRGIYRLPEGTSRSVYAATSTGNSLRAITAGPGGTFWVGGTHSTPANANLYRVDADRSVTAFPFTEPVTGLAVAGGALYVATATVSSSIITASKVWRFPLDGSGSLGAGTVLYDVTADRGAGIGASSLAVAADGTVFVATNGADPIVEVAPDGTASTLYPGVIPSPIESIAWAPGSKLYAIQGVPPETEGVARLLTIDTRRQGPY